MLQATGHPMSLCDRVYVFVVDRLGVECTPALVGASGLFFSPYGRGP